MADEQFNELDMRVDATLASGSTWTSPPSDLRAKVLEAALAAETAETAASGDVTAVKTTAESGAARDRQPAPVADLMAERKRRGPHWVLAALAGAAAAVVGTLTFIQLRDTKPTVDATAALSASAAYPGVDGTAKMRETSSGWEFRLTTKNLTRLDKPFFYEAWIEGDKGLIPIGTFHTGVDVILWGGVELDEYPKIVITKEQEDGDPAPSDDRVLTGTVVFSRK